MDKRLIWQNIAGAVILILEAIFIFFFGSTIEDTIVRNTCMLFVVLMLLWSFGMMLINLWRMKIFASRGRYPEPQPPARRETTNLPPRADRPPPPPPIARMGHVPLGDLQHVKTITFNNTEG